MNNVEKTRLGITVNKVRPGVLELAAHTEHEKEYLQNAYVKLADFSQSGYAPEPFKYRQQEGVLVLEDLGETEPVTDEAIFRRHITELILALKRHRIIHGDATDRNIIVKDNKPYLIDFQQAIYEHEAGPPKRPGDDADWLWKAAEGLSPDTSRHIRKWRAIRPYLQEGSILDLGCADGDYLFFAMADNSDRVLHGVDRLKVTPCSEHLIGVIAYGDIMHHEHFRYDNVLLFSVFAHLQDEHNWGPVDDLMKAIMADCGTLWFETQLFGDGPGPINFVDDSDVSAYLEEYASNVETVVTIPVAGRPSHRTIWKVWK